MEKENASTFLEAINKYAEQQKNHIQSEVEKFKQEEIKKAENEVLNDAYKLIQREITDMKKEIKSDISKHEMNSRRELLKQRESIFKSVFKKAEQRLLEYTKGSEYPKLLVGYAKNINSVLNHDDNILYVKQDDMQYEGIIKSAFGRDCKVEVDDHIDIGGIRAINKTVGLVADETLDAKLYHERAWFAQNSGLRVI